jgi:hypothetical protein
MQLPRPRGPISAELIDALRSGSMIDPRPPHEPAGREPLIDEDLQLALWVCYELYYRGFDGVDPDREWDTGVIAFRRTIEDVVLAELRRQIPVTDDSTPVPERLKTLIAADDGPSLSAYMQRRATRAQFEEFAIHRSIHQLKEADPDTWAIPRLLPRAKSALVEIQADEYGGGMLEQMHQQLFAGTLRGLGLDDGYCAYLDAVPGVTLALFNLRSLFGLNRRLRGALVGYLAAFEMTSPGPNRRYSQGLRRLGLDEDTRRFYDVHVTADALHEQLAAYDLCGGLVADEPELADDVIFGAACCLHLEAAFARHLLDSWRTGRSSLLEAPVTAERSLSSAG